MEFATLWAVLRSSAFKMAATGVVCAIGAASVSVWATGIYYRSDIANLKLAAAQTHDANTSAALKQFQTSVAQIADAAKGYQALQDNMTTNFDVILKDFRNAKFKNPLPVDCKPDAERLRVLTAAVTAANSFASAGQQASPGLPGN